MDARISEVDEGAKGDERRRRRRMMVPVVVVESETQEEKEEEEKDPNIRVPSYKQGG